MRKYLVFIMILCSVFILSACQSNSGCEGNGSSDGATSQKNEYEVTDVFSIGNQVVAIGNVIEGEFKENDEVVIKFNNKEYRDKIVKVDNSINSGATIMKKGENGSLLLEKTDKDSVKRGAKIYTIK